MELNVRVEVNVMLIVFELTKFVVVVVVVDVCLFVCLCIKGYVRISRVEVLKRAGKTVI